MSAVHAIDAEAARALLTLPRFTLPETQLLWAKRLRALELGRRLDATSDLAFRAWKTRWQRGEEGRGRRLWHYVRAATAQAEHDAGAAELAVMPLGAARGHPPREKASGFWQPGEARAAEWLLTLPVFEWARGTLLCVELFAWRDGAPARWWQLTGALQVLGRAALEAALLSGEPARLYASPARWNRAGGGGAPGGAVLDWNCGFARALLGQSVALIADDVGEARQLQRRVDRARPRVQFVARAG